VRGVLYADKFPPDRAVWTSQLNKVLTIIMTHFGGRKITMVENAPPYDILAVSTGSVCIQSDLLLGGKIIVKVNPPLIFSAKIQKPN